jgi:hypothetical protein
MLEIIIVATAELREHRAAFMKKKVILNNQSEIARDAEAADKDHARGARRRRPAAADSRGGETRTRSPKIDVASDCAMITSKIAASREFNADELALVTGGRSAKPSGPIEFLTVSLKQVSDQLAANVLPIIIKTAREAAWSAVQVTDILNRTGRFPD